MVTHDGQGFPQRFLGTFDRLYSPQRLREPLGVFSVRSVRLWAHPSTQRCLSRVMPPHGTGVTKRKGEARMGAKVYVGNLPFSVDEQQLRALFEEGGRQVLEVKVVTDRFTARPRGFAFVNMASAQEAEAVIQALNGRETAGRTIVVSMAREQAPRQGGFNRGGGGRRDTY